MSRSDRSKPFHRISVENSFNASASKAVLIEWAMEEWFNDDGPWVFNVYRARREDLADWELITSVSNQSFAYDVDRNSYGIGIANYYKVEVVTQGKDRTPHTYTSQHVLAGNNLNRRDYRLLAVIFKKERGLLEKRTGARGWLLPFPKFGESSDNTDPNTGEIIDSQNPDDFGTGKVGGYWGPIPAFAELSPEKRLTRLTKDGKISAIVRTASVISHPRFSPRDVWVNGMTDERFFIGPEVSVSANIRGVPIKHNVSLEAIEAGNIIYTIPVPMQV